MKEDLIKSIDIQLENETIVDGILLERTREIKTCVQESIEWLVHQHAVDKNIPDGLETMVLSRMYHKMQLKVVNDYHWHVVTGFVHAKNDAHLYGLDSNHSLAISNPKNEKE